MLVGALAAQARVAMAAPASDLVALGVVGGAEETLAPSASRDEELQVRAAERSMAPTWPA